MHCYLDGVQNNVEWKHIQGGQNGFAIESSRAHGWYTRYWMKSSSSFSLHSFLYYMIDINAKVKKNFNIHLIIIDLFTYLHSPTFPHRSRRICNNACVLFKVSLPCISSLRHGERGDGTMLKTKPNESTNCDRWEANWHCLAWIHSSNSSWVAYITSQAACHKYNPYSDGILSRGLYRSNSAYPDKKIPFPILQWLGILWDRINKHMNRIRVSLHVKFIYF